MLPAARLGEHASSGVSLMEVPQSETEDLQMLLVEEEHLLRRCLVDCRQLGLGPIEPAIDILIVPADVDPAIATVILLDRVHLMQQRVPGAVLGRHGLPVVCALLHVTAELDHLLLFLLLLGRVAFSASLLLLGRGGLRLLFGFVESRVGALAGQ